MCIKKWREGICLNFNSNIYINNIILIYMENIVLELSRVQSNDSPMNAVWTTNLSKPIKIEQGDEIIIKQAFLDTRQIDQNSIEIPEDIQWTLQFGYYMKIGRAHV